MTDAFQTSMKTAPAPNRMESMNISRSTCELFTKYLSKLIAGSEASPDGWNPLRVSVWSANTGSAEAKNMKTKLIAITIPMKNAENVTMTFLWLEKRFPTSLPSAASSSIFSSISKSLWKNGMNMIVMSATASIDDADGKSLCAKNMATSE